MPYLLIICGLIGVAVFLALFLKSNKSKKQALAALHQVLLLVTIPQRRQSEAEHDSKPTKEYLAQAEQFFSSLGVLISQSRKQKWPPLAFETSVHLLDEEIHFYVAVPERLVEEMTKEIHAFYPEAHVEPVDDYNIFHPNGEMAAAYVVLEKNPILPLKTYQTFEIDPLLSFANSLVKLAKEGEGAAIQVLLDKGDSELNERASKAAKKLMEGQSLKEAFSGSKTAETLISQVVLSAGTVITLSGSQEKKDQDLKASQPKTVGPAEQQIAQMIQEKAGHQNFKANIRILTSAQTKERAEFLLNNLKGSFSQFNNPMANSFKIREIRSKSALKKEAFKFSFRIFSDDEAVYLSTDELASVWHFPPQNLPAPKIKWLKARSAEPPSNLPEEGIVLGENIFRNDRRLVRMKADDRRRHFYIIGQTGTGKSTLMHEMIRQDMESGHGLAVIDPHGTLVEPLLGLVPKNRAEDVIYFNPGMTERPMGLNMLEWKTEEQKDFAVSEMIGIFMKLFPPEYIGPMFEHDMRNAMLTIMADPENPGTIVEIPRIFTDKEFVRSKMPKVTDPVVRSYWEKEAAQTTDFHKSEKLGYLISKLGRFLENSMMRNILGQAQSSFNFREAMDSNKIILANLSKGRVGEMNSYLLGMILVSKILIAAFSRVDTAQNFLKDFYLYVDEFQNFTTDSVVSILAEARKYRLNLVIAHQFIGQLPQNIKDAVFGNVGSIASYRVGSEDAEFLSKQFAPIFGANDLVNIENYSAYIKMLIDGYPSRPFSIRSFPQTKGEEQWANQVMALSVLKYGRPREIVESEIWQKLQSTLSAPSTTPSAPSEIR